MENTELQYALSCVRCQRPFKYSRILPLVLNAIYIALCAVHVCTWAIRMRSMRVSREYYISTRTYIYTRVLCARNALLSVLSASRMRVFIYLLACSLRSLSVSILLLLLRLCARLSRSVKHWCVQPPSTRWKSGWNLYNMKFPQFFLAWASSFCVYFTLLIAQ